MGDTVVTFPDKNLLGVIKDIDRISNVEPSKEFTNFDKLYLDDKQNYIDNVTSFNELHEQAKKLAVSNVWGIDAIALNKKILEIDNKNSLSYTRLAKCYTACGKVDEAKQLYEEVLTFDKNNTIAKNRLDQIELDQRNKQAQLDNRDNSNIYRKYINHCYTCKSGITDEMFKCSKCGWYICEKCGACGCDYDH